MLRLLFLLLCVQSFGLLGQSAPLSDGSTLKVTIPNPKGAMVQPGEHFRFHATMLTQTDSTMFSTREQGEPMLMQLDTTNQEVNPISEALQLMHVGETVRVFISLDDFPVKPPGMENDSIVIYEVELLELVSDAEIAAQKAEEEKKAMEARAAAMAREADVLAFHKKVLADYQAGSLTAFDTTASGLRYIIHERGEGEVPAKGDKIAVHYIGSLAEGEAEPFDQSFSRGEPIEFSVGTGMVIPGWDEGLMLLPHGSRATFFIPADLAYGDRGAGSAIPGGAELVFYVELLEKK